MATNIRRALLVSAVCTALGAANADGQSSNRIQTTASQTTLGAAGYVNSTPSLAARDRIVAAVWTGAKDGIVNVFFSISHDAGATFSEPRRVNDQAGDVSVNNEQPPRVVISGAGNGPIFTIVWSKRNESAPRARRDVIRMARSTDGGRTFSPARTTHDPAFSGARGWQSLADVDGVVHAVWLDGRDAERKLAEAAAHSAVAHKGQPPQDVYHGTISLDGRVSESLIATDVCFCCKTAVAVDARGAVYAAWRHIFPGSMRDIAFAKSTDGGRHFTPLVRVSQDNWELNGCPEDGPALAVDQAGLIHIAWTTVINQGEPQKALFYATSRDGKTFSRRARVPTAGITTPGHPQLSLNPGGGAAIVWDEISEGVRRISLTQVSRDGAFRSPQILSGTEPASHPGIVRSGSGNLLVAWASRLPATSSPSEGSMIRLRRVSVVR